MREVFYLTSNDLHKALSNIDKIRHRSYLVDSLIQAYERYKHKCFHVIQPELATENELALTHDRDYLEFLNIIANIDIEHDSTYNEQMDLYKIGYECPPFEDLPSFCLSKLLLISFEQKNPIIFR